MDKKNRRFVNAGREGFHLVPLTGGAVLLHTVNKRGQFDNGVTITRAALDQVYWHLAELRQEILGKAPGEK